MQQSPPPKPYKRACDQCKYRKTKCSMSQPCTTCIGMGFNCTFERQPRKRGPAGKRVSEIQQRQLQRSQNSVPGSPTSDSNRPLSSSALNSPSLDAGFAQTGHIYPNRIDSGGSNIFGLEDLSWPDASSSVDSLVFADDLSTAVTSDMEYWLPSTFDTGTNQLSNLSLQATTPSSLPPLIKEEVESLSPDYKTPELSSGVSDGGTTFLTSGGMADIWPPTISEESLLPWLNVYFERLHPTLPVLDQSTLFSDIHNKRHHTDAQFGAMILSLCAFALTQPIQFNEQSSSSSRATQAKYLMEEATKMRSCSNFGEVPTLEAVLTSFYLFASLFGSNQHNAAWLRLREAVDLGESLGLPDIQTYFGLDPKEGEKRLRTYLVLSITERAYALQKRHSINFKGRPGVNMQNIRAAINFSESQKPSTAFHDENDGAIMTGLNQLMRLFDVIDEDVVECWNEHCKASFGHCQKFDAARVIAIHESLSQPISQHLTETQEADISITQEWLLDRLWQLSFSHKLLELDEQTPALRYDFAIATASDTLNRCRSLGLYSMEAHGIGLIEKVYDIAMSAHIAMFYSLPASTGLAESSNQEIRQGFHELLSRLRGGKHPYLSKYVGEVGLLSPAPTGAFGY